jgi:transcriptional regulator with XRE-family HTH domain
VPVKSFPSLSQTILPPADLRLLRVHRRWSLRELARRTGVSAALLFKIEKGERGIPHPLAVRLIHALYMGTDAPPRS